MRILRDNGYRRNPHPITSYLLDVACNLLEAWERRRRPRRVSATYNLLQAEFYEQEAARLRAEARAG